MRFFAHIAAVGFLSVASAHLAVADTFKSYEGRFAIDFPSKPTLSVARSVGSCLKRVYEYRVNEFRGRSWAVRYRDCQPPGMLADVGINPTLVDLGKTAAKVMGGQLRASDPIEHGVLSGREVLVLVPDVLVLRARFFIEGDRIYTIEYRGAIGTEADPEVEAFFASFQIMR